MTQRNLRRILDIFALAVLVLSTLTIAFAQFDSASVLGTVRDPTGAPMAAAKVLLENPQTGIAQTTTTDQEGNYQILNVPIGTYRLSSEAPGFKRAVAAQFTVTVGARQRVDLSLQVGDVAEQIEVTDAATPLETDTSSRGTVVGSNQIVNLPLNGRSYADLALLAPGVRKSSIATGSTPRDASFNVNGMRSSLNNFIIDGVDNNAYGTSNQGFSNQVVQLSPDAVQEFRIETTSYSAEFGRAGGGIINASIRSGTNSFHGSAWEYLRNTKLNATGFFQPVNNQKPVLIQNQFGAAFGGPVIRNKAFFFMDYEGFRRVQRRVTFSTLPTLDQRGGNLGIPVRNPYTGEVYSNGVIPSTAITRFAREVLAGLPAPNLPGLANNFQSQPAQTDNSDKGDVRYDHYLGSRLNVFARYSHRELNQFVPPSIPGPSGGDSNGNVRVNNKQIAVGANFTVSPTSMLEARVGYSRSDGGKFPIFLGEEGVAEKFGIPNVPSDPRYTGGIYRQAVNGYTAFGVQNSNPQYQNPDVLNPKINFTKILGSHSLKAGYEYQAINTQIDDFAPKYGTDAYAGRFSQIPGTANNNLQFLADFLFGARSQYQLATPAIVNYEQRTHFFYLQDDFKVTPKFTLNIGVRYEFATPQYERDNKLSNFDPATNSIIQAKDGSIYDRALIHPDRNNWAPRIGFAYNLFDKTVIRSGYGISHIHFNRMGGENLLAYNLPNILNPVVDQLAPLVPTSGQPLCTSLNDPPSACFRPTEQGYPNNFMALSNINQRNVRTNYIPADYRTSYTQSWHFTIQHELAKDLVLDLGYVGTRGVGLMILGDYNQAVPNAAGQNLSVQARRPIQNFGFIQEAFGAGFLNYHAFQVKLEKRYSAGLYLLNSFTWSKAIDNASGHLETANGDNSRVNIRDLRNEKGLSGYDQPFNNTTSFTYELPFGRSRKFGSNWHPVLDGVAGGWRVTGINTMTSGLPVNLTYSPSSQLQVSSAPNYRPNITGDPLTPEGQRGPTNYLNPNTVVSPTDPTLPFGNAGRNIVRAPSLFQLDLGLHKDFRITEGSRLEFRTEAFNILNKTNFMAPDSNRSNNSFGTITSTFPWREIQMALRFVF
jgi:hypothetical protein